MRQSSLNNPRRMWMMLLFAMMSVATWAQTHLVKGVVKDDSGEPLIGVTVREVGAKANSITDIDGNYSIQCASNATLQFDYIGYETQKVGVGGRSVVDVTLHSSAQKLNEVVVVGFGSQKKENLTGAVSTVTAKDLTARPVNNVKDALQGMVPGMNFTTGANGGALNSNKGFNIRGTGTIGSGSSLAPLVLIDGMEGDLNTLNPQDIENISVLKDASASSIYGSRAAGGVVLVTTRGGKEGKFTVNYNNSFRFNSLINVPDMLDSYTWALYMNDASINSGAGVWFSDQKLAALKEAQTNNTMPKMFRNSANKWEIWNDNDNLPLGNTNWMKEFFGTSFSQEHNVSLTGGSDRLKYYFSANYLGQDGILRYGKEARNRYNLTGKVNANITDWLNFSYSTRFARVDYTAPYTLSEGNGLFYHQVVRRWPIIPVKDPNGHYVDATYINQMLDGGVNESQEDQFAQQLALVLSPIKDWNIHLEFNYRANNNFNHQDWQTVYGYDADDKPFVIDHQVSGVYEYAYKSNYFNPNFYTDYTRAFGDHNMKVMLGYQSEWLHQRSFTAQQKNMISGIPTLNTTTSDPSVTGGPATWSTAGFFGRLNYDYKGRYLFEANLRYDGSSRFTREKRWNLFPSFSFGWNIAQEGFWASMQKHINTLKLRASWGQLGNQNTDNWYPFYQTIPYKTKNGNWLVNGQKTNVAEDPALISALLTWEKNRTWEIGLDWGALNNRLTGSFDYFQRKTFDMVGPAPELPDVLGAAVPKVNNLDMTSKGWELQLSWRDRIADFRYGVTLNLSDNFVTIDKYPNPSKTLGTHYAGSRLGDIWGYTTVGIAKTQEEMDAHLAKANQSAIGSNWSAGDIMYADLDGDFKVNGGEGTADKPGDKRIIGNSTPRYNFGLNLDAAWKGFDLKIFFQGVLKRDFDAGGPMFWGALGQGKWQGLGFKEHLDYFRAEANHPLGQNLDSYYPRLSWNGGRNTQTQTRYLQNAAYCRLKNITLGYTLPAALTKRIAVQNVRVFVSAENILTITNFIKTADPELAGVGYLSNSNQIGKTYPLTKSFSMGLSVTF